MAKNGYKRKRAYQAAIHRQLREGLVNRADGSWRLATTGEENDPHMQVYARRNINRARSR